MHATNLPWWTVAYRIAAFFGMFTVTGSLVFGFRHSSDAPKENYLFNLGLYAAYMIPHLVMTRGWFKRTVWGKAEGGPAERRVYILVAVVGWLVVLSLARPVPGPAWDAPDWVRFAGTVAFLSFFAFGNEGIQFATLEGMFAVPGAQAAFSHGPDTPLLCEGQYAQVRHPMYRSAVLAGLASLLIHPHAAQVFWGLLIGATLIGFIPIEEAQLRAARKEDYEAYCRRVPYRLFRGIW
jgi:protein-S-isoprenylcysteine O-methyltransferase Ste14